MLKEKPPGKISTILLHITCYLDGRLFALKAIITSPTLAGMPFAITPLKILGESMTLLLHLDYTVTKIVSGLL